jgi:putative PIN family toxin of toxin-antitoxin system
VRLVLDTNVLVAGLLNPVGPCGRLLDLVLDGAVEICLDERILREYADVLRRPRLSLPARSVADLLAFLQQSAEPVVAAPLAIKLPDPDDLPFLEIASSAGAVLVTGNRRHFPSRHRRGVHVMAPAECLQALAGPSPRSAG